MKDNTENNQIDAISEKLDYLLDLFARRLYEDRQKKKLIEDLESAASYSLIEPFLSDIFLILDRMEKSDDDFVRSLYEELYDVLERRGVSQIIADGVFDPKTEKAVKAIEDNETDQMEVRQVLRNGYTFHGKTIRAAEVIVAVPGGKDLSSDMWEKQGS